MNWAGISTTAGIVALAFVWPPYSLVLLLGVAWVWWRS